MAKRTPTEAAPIPSTLVEVMVARILGVGGPSGITKADVEPSSSSSRAKHVGARCPAP